MTSSVALPSPGTVAARNYAIVTAAYWGFTLTDGALRMLVLLHFFRLGYSPFTLAFLFLLYEAAGIVANLIGGWLATRFGIARMLAVGLTTQIAGFVMLSAMSPDWSAAISVAWVVAAQGVCGVAKDLTKTASKSAIKLTAGEASGRLFHWVAWFTGSKNAMKGAGFFLGAGAPGAPGPRGGSAELGGPFGGPSGAPLGGPPIIPILPGPIPSKSSGRPFGRSGLPMGWPGRGPFGPFGCPACCRRL